MESAMVGILLYDARPMYFAWFISALAVTGPIYLWLLAGASARRLGWVDQQLVELSAQISFRLGMPVVLFFGASRVDYSSLLQSHYLLAGLMATLVVTVLAQAWGKLRGFAPREASIFVQGSFRSNLGIVGIALCASAYGEAGLALAALPVAVMTILYNIIAVLVLNRAHQRDSAPLAVLLGIIRNPLIIGIGLGVLLSVSGMQLSVRVYQLGQLISSVVLPVALITIGASMSLKVLRQSGPITLDTMTWRHLVSPLIGVLIASLFGVYGPELGVLFLLLSSPIAAASFVMVVAVGGNGPLAANLIVVSTLLSGITTTLGFALLNGLGLV
jgi:hypothetical protein